MPPTSTQSDAISVDLEARNLPAAVRDVNTFRETVKGAAADLDNLGNGAKLNAALQSGIDRANQLRATLRDAATAANASGNTGLRGYATGANQANAEVRQLVGSLRQLQADAARSTNPVSLEIIRREAERVGAQLDAIEAKSKRVLAGRGVDDVGSLARSGPSAGEIRYGRINLARQGADVFTQAGSGASPGLIAIQQGPQIIEAVAQAGLKVSSVATVAAGSVALVGAAVVAYSDSTLKAAERRLKLEEKISAEYGRQQKALADLKSEAFDFERARANAADDRRFGERLNDRTGNPDLLRLERDRLVGELERRRRDDFFRSGRGELAGDNLERANAERNRIAGRIQQLDAALDPVSMSRRFGEQADKSFAEFQERQAAEAKANYEKNQAQLKSIAEARSKIIELEGSTNQLFENLFAQQGADNPFVRIFSEGEKATESFRIATAALSKDIQDQGVAMIKQATELQAFTARIGNRLSASDLRADAARFRRGGSGAAESDQDFAARTERALRQLGFDPKDFRDLTVQQQANFVANRQFGDIYGAAENANRDATAAALERNGLSRFNGRFGENGFVAGDVAFDPATARFNGVSLATLAQGAALNAQQRAGQDETVQERLNRQLAILESGGATTDAQRAEVNRRIIALTSSIDPSQLTNAQNNAAAAAREAEAARLESNERDARALLDRQAVAAEKVAADINKLLKIAESEGLTGTIRIINEAENSVRTQLGKRPNENDSASAMQP
jgi:hypothetical protein